MMQPACELLEVRDGEPRHVEHRGQIDGDHLVPVVGRILLDRQRQAGDAGIVDQHVEAAERLDRGRHHALDLGAAGHVAAPRDQARDLLDDLASALSSMSQTKTLAPLPAKARANSRPMPDAPAVINTRCTSYSSGSVVKYSG